MSQRATVLALTWAAFGLTAAPAAAQPVGAVRPPTPSELFQSSQQLILDGRYDVAAEELKRFLASNPSDPDLIALQQRDAAVFHRLRNVTTWFDDPAAQAEAVRTVEAIIAKAESANKKLYRDPTRIARFVRNLGATLEERLFAEQELLKAGDAVVPAMVDALRTSSDADLRAGIYLAIRRMRVDVVAGMLGATEGLAPDVRLGLLKTVAARTDVLNLLSTAETDFSPLLWYYSASQDAAARSLRDFSAEYLRQLAGARADRARPEDELVRIAATFQNQTARFRNKDQITLWAWDPAKQTVTSATVSKRQAEDYYGLRYVKWALNVNPVFEPAQDLFLTISIERAVERGQFRDIAETDPALYRVVAATPSMKLIELATLAMSRKQTALTLGLIGALAVRADKMAAGGTPAKPGLFARALDYPDSRVQLAAATGLMRAPVPPTHGKSARVVEILRRALSGSPEAGKGVGRVLIADPVASRGGKLVDNFQKLGYVAELFASGRDLMRRVARASDFDLIVIDRHTVDPLLPDLLPQLQSDLNSARRPVLIVASADKPRDIPLEHLLLRLAVLIATDDATATVPQPFYFDPRKAESRDLDKEKLDLAARRDKVLGLLFENRAARLRRLIDAANLLPISRDLMHRLELRVPQVTYAALAAGIPVTPESSPDTYGRFRAQNAIILGQPSLSQPLLGLATDTLASFAERIETGLTPEQRQRFEATLARIDSEALGLPTDNLRDSDLEFRLAQVAQAYPVATVIPEPFGLAAFTDDIQAAVSDPAAMPRNPDEKAASARLAAELLRQIAVGEHPGYDARPAADVLRAALKSDDLAPITLGAVVRIPTAEAQQDLLNVALGGRPEPLRLRAADATIRHIQSFGKLIPPNMIAAIPNAQAPSNEMKSKLQVIHELLAGKPGDLGALMLRYPVATPQPAATSPPPSPPDPAATPPAANP